MKLPPDMDLSYCLNVHPGECWADNFQAIKTEACRVRDQVCPQDPFGLGLRLGKQAVDDLKQPGKLAEFKAFLARENLYVFTINAFPYGNFHSTPVKEAVYRPDWTGDSRVAYTLAAAEILAELLPEGEYGSISTVPVSYKGFNLTDAEIAITARNLVRLAWELNALKQRTGRLVVLALEPEPDCLIENTDEFLDYYQTRLLPEARKAGVSEAVVRLHIGICFDTAHAAVEFEDMIPALDSLTAAGITIAKLQISSALAAADSPAARTALKNFCEPVYLHQTKIRRPDGAVAHFADLPMALAADEDQSTKNEEPDGEWRVHYHVPLFWQGTDVLRSTSNLLPPLLAYVFEKRICRHLEIETYTFTVLPADLAPASLTVGIVREFNWLLKEISPGS